MVETEQTQNKRDLVSIDDLTNEEIESLFQHADQIAKDLKGWSHLCPGFILATLFHEPSTRTRLSFESSMLRLGGGVISVADAKSSSAVKGESLADTIRIVGGAYADMIVLRHPKEGAARLAADYANVPVINAGDGSHEHPTQTLCDLYSLRTSKGPLKGLDVVLCGDLKHSRTVHSLSYALARFGANIICAPHPGMEMPEYVVNRLREEFHSEARRASLKEFQKSAPDIDALYFTPESPHQLSLFPLNSPVELKKVDALYVTRPQKERFQNAESSPSGKAKTEYLRIDRNFLMSEKFREAIVMHPLPRTEELAPELDSDPRSLYFRQAALGVPMRMAIVAALLGKLKLPTKKTDRSVDPPMGSFGLKCPNTNCISLAEEIYVGARFHILSGKTLRARCYYCRHELPVQWMGFLNSKDCRTASFEEIRKSNPAEIALFSTEKQASQAGFRVCESI